MLLDKSHRDRVSLQQITTKKELAQAYCPDIDYTAALKKLNHWIRTNTELSARLAATGLHGWEVTDLKVTFTQAEYYSPVSTPADFRQLTPYVFRLALQQSGVDILGTQDAPGANIFITLHNRDNGTKLRMGPLWDFDSDNQTTSDWAAEHSSPVFYGQQLFNNPTFVHAYVSCWEQVRPLLYNRVVHRAVVGEEQIGRAHV